MKLEDAAAIRRAHWAEGYRLAHRDADRWASSPSGIRHSVETQDHIFRMVEELRGRPDWPNARPFFPVLKAVDDAASWETDANDTPTPTSAAAAGLLGYKVLFGKLPPVRDHDWPEGFLLTAEAESELATFGLRLSGFDPVVFDGTDPAAYVWALFEVGEREAACDQAVRRFGHRACPPRGLAVVATPIRPKTTLPVPLHPAKQPAGVGR
ncbi:MAG TPA: hypothetical protein VN973_00685 [Candidatus Dormibacteraeota bacterium]|nr:hypothetical protein [Candidatus Dormibacteraeota bacterium]